MTTSQLSTPLNQGAAQASLNATREIVLPHLLLAATPFAYGGGDEHIIPAGKFKDRRVGKGTRNEIYGSARFGSGYGHYTHTDNGWKYEPDTSLNVAVNSTDLPGVDFVGPPRPYPFDSPSRQGAIVAIRNDQVWNIVADAATVNVLYDVLQLPEQQGGCGLDGWSIRVNTISYYNVTAPGEENPVIITQMDAMIPPYHFFLRPWNVIQYYRGSSVFLASRSYDNEYAHPGSNNTDYWKATPLNTTGVDLAFLNCLNTTIAAAIPIADPTFVVQPPNAHKNKLSSGQIAGIAVGGVVGLLLLVGLCVWLFVRRRRAHEYDSISKGVAPPSHSSGST